MLSLNWKCNQTMPQCLSSEHIHTLLGMKTDFTVEKIAGGQYIYICAPVNLTSTAYGTCHTVLDAS